MAFLGNLIRAFMGSDGVPGNRVIEVGTSQYSRVPIVSREECLLLYGPTKDQLHEIVFQKPVSETTSKAFSLLRTSNNTDAQIKLLSLKNTLLPLVEVMPVEVTSQQMLQTICDLTQEHPAWSAAHMAAHLGFVRCFARPQIAKFADTADLQLKETPLHIAISSCQIDVIRVLLASGVDMDALDCKGNSVYHLAAITHKGIIEVLSQRESHILDSPNAAGKTPLHLACLASKSECVKALLSAGADVNVAATGDQTLPIHAAMTANSTTCASEIIRMYPNQLNATDMMGGGTPLHWATSKEMVNAMCDLGCQINARNFHGLTALHKMVLNNRFLCVVALLTRGADVSVTDDEGDSVLHIAPSAAVVQALLVFGADPIILNNKKMTCRHCIATSSHREKDSMLYMLTAIGAPRCQSGPEGPSCSKGATGPLCVDGCSPRGQYEGQPPPGVVTRGRFNFDELLDDIVLKGGDLFATDQMDSSSPIGGARVLSLDGGGIKGLILIRLLMTLEVASGRSILSLFDWVGGTSTGGILALALAVGKSTRHCLGLYFRMKDLVFVGRRPYDERPLEEILRQELGENSVMADITGVRVAVTGVLADRFPADLHLFRNYQSAEVLLQAPLGDHDGGFQPPKGPKDQLIWNAARATGAAPSYFRAYGRFIDGGLISNNPTLDILTEIQEYNTALKFVQRQHEAVKPAVVVSLGTGRAPVAKVNAIDCFSADSFWGSVQMAFGLSNMAKLLIDQVTMSDNRTVDRARSWCAMCGISYIRLSPQLSLDISLDETRDDILLNAMWETMAYAYRKRESIRWIAHQLNTTALANHNGPINFVD